MHSNLAEQYWYNQEIIINKYSETLIKILPRKRKKFQQQQLG